MPSRSMVRRAARAVGTTTAVPAASTSRSTSVASASISGTSTRRAHEWAASASITARSCAGSLITAVRAAWATWWPGAWS